jgi:hypothetical protein
VNFCFLFHAASQAVFEVIDRRPESLTCRALEWIHTLIRRAVSTPYYATTRRGNAVDPKTTPELLWRGSAGIRPRIEECRSGLSKDRNKSRNRTLKTVEEVVNRDTDCCRLITQPFLDDGAIEIV